MNSIRLFSFISLVSLFLLFSITVDGHSGSAIKKEKKNSFLSPSSVHSDFFLQPQADTSVYITEKTPNTFQTKHFESNFSISLDFITLQVENTYVISQDINRCENVSQLLFPFHFFW